MYDASDPKGKYTNDIFREQNIDIICSGNHELYKANSSNNEYLDTVPNFKGNYLASNLDIINPKTGERVPLAQRYKKFTTKNQGIRIVAFGFLFDFTGNANNTVVQPVEETIRQKWFQDAVQDREVDLFLVAGHVAIRSDEYLNIYRAIRKEQWDTPIQFFGGHTHIRDYKRYDKKAYALESGRYMETLGFQAISGLKTGGKEKLARTASPTFARRYIDNNLYSFYHHTSLNSSTFSTPHGHNVSSLILSSRKALKLDSQYGCAPIDLWTNRAPYPSNTSIFSWLERLVLPDMVLNVKGASGPRIAIVNTGAMRFDIFRGPFTKDTTFSVSPFTTGFRYLKNVPFGIADRLLTVLNNEGNILAETAPSLKAGPLASPEQRFTKMKPPATKQEKEYHMHQQEPLVHKPTLTPGYTTHDDDGDDGDDTVHAPITFYRVPNCIEARAGIINIEGDEQPVDGVDVIYLEFVEPWILLALRFLGADVDIKDTEVWLDGEDFTTMIARWVKENWQGEC